MVVNRPPMGWNTWNTFGEEINEQLVIESADALVSSGLKDAGYEYIVIDDCWALKERGADGRLVADPEKFPHGMKYVADYVHSKELKFGMYSCSGYITCGGYPGSYEHEWTDAQTFAEWGVDFLKYDFCFRTSGERPDLLYKRMSLALANSGRDILFSACSWGHEYTRLWIKETGAHMWRSTGDIFDTWPSIKKIAQSQLVSLEYNGQGCFNDMDMLVVGMNGRGNVGMQGCTEAEYRLHFSLWAMLGSPLMIGCDIRNMDDATKAILTNREVIAINQDGAYRQPYFVNQQINNMLPNENRTSEQPFYLNYPIDTPVLAKYLDNGDIAIGVFNFNDGVKRRWIGVTPDMLGLPVTTGKTLEITDLWTGEKVEMFNGMLFPNECQPHDCRMYRARIVDAK